MITEAELLSLVAARERMPGGGLGCQNSALHAIMGLTVFALVYAGVDRLQTSYARYFRHAEAQVQPNWQLGISRKNYELAVRAGAIQLAID